MSIPAVTSSISEYRIPYDVDYTWDGGCNGKDLFKDEYGMTMRLLFVSSNDSAYICPENYRGQFRIYIDSKGHGWSLEKWPNVRYVSYVEAPSANKVKDMLACAIKTSSVFNRQVTSLFKQVHDYKLPIRGYNKEINVADEYNCNWKISIDSRGIDIERSYKNGCEELDYHVRGARILYHHEFDCDTDFVDGTEVCDYVPYVGESVFNRMSLSTLTDAVLLLPRGLDKEMASYAIENLQEGLNTIAEIENFERLCRR